MGWPNVRHIVDLEPVSGAVASRPDRALEARTDDLDQRLGVTEAGQALFAYSLAIDPSLPVGQPVYYNSTLDRYDRAWAAVAYDPATHLPYPAPASVVFGLVFAKQSGGLATILTMGYAAIDLSAAVDGPVQAGRYYLSASAPGKLVRQRVGLSAAVLIADGKGNVLLLPQARDFLGDHVHYAFDLHCRPAGTPVTSGGFVHLTGANTALTGWLPAGHPSFAGLAPHGAFFGYNLATHPELLAAWPPLPPSAAVLVWQLGREWRLGEEVPLGDGGLAVIDANGIWWTSDCAGEVPWLNDPDESSASSLFAHCPRPLDMRLRLYFAKAPYTTLPPFVTSLVADSASPLTVRSPAGGAAQSGDLVLGFDASVAGGGNLVAEIVQLVGAAALADDLGLPYLSLPPGAPSKLIFRTRIPDGGLPLNPRVVLRLRLLGLQAGTLPPSWLALSCEALARPLSGPLAVPSVGLAVGLNAGVVLGGNQYFEATSAPVVVAAGDVLYWGLTRNAPDAYAGTAGLFEASALLQRG